MPLSDWKKTPSRRDERLSKMSKSKGLRVCNRAADPREPSLADFGKQVIHARSVLENVQKELKSVSESLTGMEGFYRVNLQKPGLAEMEEFFKEKLLQERCARQEAEEELKSFKDRVAGEVGLTLKTGNSESMNNPVNETRLKEMYEDLWKQWRKIKPELQSLYRDPKDIRAYIQKHFGQAAEEMQRKKRHIEMAFNRNDSSSQKVIEYTKLSIQNLQLAVFHCREEAAAAQKDENPDAVMKDFISNCKWLSCLLALNNPPLQPDWEHHYPGMDPWNFFPQNIRVASFI